MGGGVCRELWEVGGCGVVVKSIQAEYNILHSSQKLFSRSYF